MMTVPQSPRRRWLPLAAAVAVWWSSGPGAGAAEVVAPDPVDGADSGAAATDAREAAPAGSGIGDNPGADGHDGVGRVDLEGGARAIDLRFQGLVLRVHRLELTDDELRLRVAFQNGTALPIQAFGSLEPGVVWLEQAEVGVPDMLPCREVDPRLRTYLPEGGLAGGTAVVGELVFPRPPADQRDWQLTIPGFEALRFSWQPDDLQPSASGAEAGGRHEAALRLESTEAALGAVPLDVEALVIDGHRLTVELAFTNRSPNDLRLNEGGPNGSHLRLITAEGEVLEPVEVDENLRQGIGPLGDPWRAWETHRGTIGFDLPDPAVLEQGALVFPGYPPARWRRGDDGRELVWLDGEGREREPARPAPGEGGDLLFNEIRQWVEDMGRELREGDGEALGRRVELGSEAAIDLAVFLQGWQQVPGTDPRWVLPSRQELAVGADGVLRDVGLRFEHGLETVDGAAFVTEWRCDLVPAGQGSWQLREIRYHGPPPFWVLGYTGFAQTEHFLLIYRPDTESADKIQASALQAERAYDTLRRKQLALEDRYVAFFVPFREDFRALTGREAGHYSGAASAMRILDREGLREVNRAMYINDHRYLVLQRALNLGDRQQTLTHELVHLALADWTRAQTPPWLVEGVAVVYADQLTPATVRGLQQSGALREISLVSLMELGAVGGAGDPRMISAQYVFSGLAVEVLLRRFGADRLLGFYRAFGEIPQEDLMAGLEAVRRDHSQADEREQLRRLRLRLTVDMMPRHFDGLTLVQLDQLTRFQAGR